MADEQEDQARAVSLANLDQLWAEIRQYKVDIQIIAEHGLPQAEDEESQVYQGVLIRTMACLIVSELGARELQ